jgi:hypothetical protein
VHYLILNWLVVPETLAAKQTRYQDGIAACPAQRRIISGLISDDRFSLTLTLCRWEREQPLEACGITNGHPASVITGYD